MDNKLRINSSRASIVPSSLLGYQLFKNFDTLYRSLPNNDLIVNLNNVTPKVLHDVIQLYLLIVNYNRTETERRYLTKRFLAMKSAEKVLWELEKYTNIIYDINTDPDASPLLMTRYKPSLLKVTIESIETDQPESILEILNALYAALLYFKDFQLHIKELVIRMNVDLQLESNSSLLTAYNITNLIDIDG